MLATNVCQVTRVSDVVSVGQKLTLKCIGQDVRGNIKLSLKATLKEDNVAEAPVSSLKEAPKYSEPAGGVFNERKKHDDPSDMSEELLVDKNEGIEVNLASSSVPLILIRSAAECEEEEKSAGLTRNSKSKSKSSVVSESDRNSKPFSRIKGKKESNSKFKSQDGDKIKQTIISLLNNSVDTEAETEVPVTAKNLKLGTKVTAKVYQIRARGLVLDLGGGLRGMYRFEVCALHYIQHCWVYFYYYYFYLLCQQVSSFLPFIHSLWTRMVQSHSDLLLRFQESYIC